MNREKQREYMRKYMQNYRKNNQERVRNYYRKWAKTQGFFQKRATAYAKKKCIKIKPIELLKLWKKQRGRCALSGRKLTRENACLDHIIPRSKGGSDHIYNLQWTTSEANKMKSNIMESRLSDMVSDIFGTLSKKSEISHYRNIHYGERCFILGNGPSLADVDLKALPGITLGSNRIYLSGFTPTYYAAVNPLVVDQYAQEIAQLESQAKFIPGHLTYLLGENAGNVIALDTTEHLPQFGSPTQSIWEGHTVTFVLLQIAYYMGFEEVILLGVDHDYGQVQQPNLEIVATGVDENHFHPDYFSGGIRWNAPDLPMSEIAYSLAKKAYEADDRRIINASGKSKLTIFERESLPRILSPLKPRVSAIVSAYKCTSYIKDCLMDLNDQTLAQKGDLEVVIVCQEGSAEEEIICNVVGSEEYDTLTRIVYTKDIPTVYAAWNKGIKSALGKYITNANSDDRLHTRAMEIKADILDARPEIDLVYSDIYVSWKPNEDWYAFYNANYIPKPGRWERQPGIFRWPEYSRELLSQGCFIGPQPMWRASLHQEHGYFHDSYISAGDYEFWLRIAKKKNILHIGGHPLGVYHARLDGIELGNPEQNWDEAQQAVILHQTPEFEIKAAGDNLVQLLMDGNYTFVETAALLDAIERVRQQHA